MKSFQPEFPTVAATVVPLILIAAVLEASLIDRWGDKINKARLYPQKTKAGHITAFMLFVGWSTLTAGFGAEFLSLWELYNRSNCRNFIIALCLGYLLVGFAIAFYNKFLLGAGIQKHELFKVSGASEGLDESAVE